MLAAAHRLRRREEFSAVMRAGRRAAAGTLVVHLIIIDTSADATADADHGVGRGVVSGPATRAGFVVSRAVGNAVERNRVRRRLRHLIRERLGDLPVGAHVVVRALPGSGGAPYSRLRSDLDAALAAARTRKSRSVARRRPTAATTGAATADPTSRAERP